MKIPIHSKMQPLEGNPFANLEIAGLPEDKTPASTSSHNEANAKPSKLGEVILRRETAHRGGKTVIVIYGFDEKIPKEQIAKLCQELKVKCGCGGKVVDRTIELQGELLERTREFFSKQGFRVRGEK